MKLSKLKEGFKWFGRQILFTLTLVIPALKKLSGYRSLNLDEKFRETSRVLKLVGTANHVPKMVEVNGEMKAIPADLRDKNPDYTYLENGQPVASILINPDFARGADKPMHGIVGLLLAGLIVLTAGLDFGVTALLPKALKFPLVTAFGFIPVYMLFWNSIAPKLKACAKSIVRVLLLSVTDAVKAVMPCAVKAGKFLVSKDGLIVHFGRIVRSPNLPLIGLFAVISIAEAGASLVGGPSVVAVLALLIGSATAVFIFDEDGWLAAKISCTFGLYLVFAYSAMTKPQGGTIIVGEGENASSVTRDRDTVLHYQALRNAASPRYLSHWQNSQEIRYRQALIAAKDSTQFIEYGRARGEVRANGNMNSPDRGMPVGQTIHDQNTHLLITGRTGGGKTVLLKKIIRQTSANPKLGWIAFDAKNMLSPQLVGICSDYKLLSPKTHKINLYAGMGPLEVTEALAIAGDREEGDWYQTARNFFFLNQVILHSAAKAGDPMFKWTPACSKKIDEDNITAGTKEDPVHGAYRTRAIELCESLPNKSLLLVGAIEWMRSDAARTLIRSKGFSATTDRMNNWLSPLFNKEEIAAWACSDADDGFDVADVCSGAHVGVDLGKGVGKDTTFIINSLLAQRIFIALEERGDDWKSMEGQTAVAFYIDEFQDVVNDNYANKIAKVRSSGGFIVGVTQSITSLWNSLGREKADAMLSNFVSAITLQTNDGGVTYDFVASRCGIDLRPVDTIHTVEGEVEGVNLFVDLSVEQMAPRDAGGNINGGAADIHKKSIIKNTISVFSDKGSSELANAGYGIVGNHAKATHLSKTGEEIGMMLKLPYTGFAAVMRAEVIRGDAIDLTL